MQAHARGYGAQVQDGPSLAHLCPVLDGVSQRRGHGRLGTHESAAGLEQALVLGLRAQSRPARADGRGIELLHRQAVEARSLAAGLQDGSAGRLRDQGPAALEQGHSQVTLQPPEVLGRGQQHGHIAGMLEVGVPEHARSAVARAARVADLELLQPNGPHPAPRQGPQGEGAHAPKAKDGHLRLRPHGAGPLRGAAPGLSSSWRRARAGRSACRT